ncbi:MAG: bifunctional tetrahydrofolate synthase/dihydrofolate synthase [Pseudomonadota bacterium]
MPDKSETMRGQQKKSGLRFNTLDKWLDWQESLHFTAIELGLERCRRVANNMGMLKPTYTVISVAGTNGKGSSVTMLDLILRDAGYRVGRYLSPHLLKYNERISVEGINASDEELCESFDRIDRARGDISLTYFEFGTLAALDLFRQHQVEVALLEVGLGGRLDAVNILDADAALISSIDLDHQQWLGDNRESIGREKAGILRNKSPAVCSDPNPPQSIIDCAMALGTPLQLAGDDFSYVTHGDTWDWQCENTSYSNLPRPMQYSDFQLQNAAGVLMLLDAIKQEYPVQRENICAGLGNFRLDGRMQMLPGRVQVILDVAHNQQAVKSLITNLRSIPCIGKTHLLVGMLKDKDHAPVLTELNEVADSWNIVSLSEDRGCQAEELVESLKRLKIYNNVNTYPDVKTCLTMLNEKTESGDRIVITGSFLTVGAALKCLT